MTKLLLILMMVGVWSGCGGDSDSPTGPSDEVTKWRKNFGYGGGSSVQQTVDGGFIVTGGDGDVLLLKTDGQGNVSGTQKLAQLVCEYLGLYKLFRAEITQSSMWSFAVIMVSPVLDDNAGFT